MAKWIEYFIAERTANSEKRGGGGVMLPTATIAVALSIAVMVITISVIFGFKREVHRKITSLSGHVVVSAQGGANPASRASIERSDAIVDIAEDAAAFWGVDISNISPYATRAAVVRGAEGVEGVVLKGVDSDFDQSLFEGGLIAGEVPIFGDSIKSRDAVIAKSLADRLQLEIGDRLELLTTDEGESMRRDLYRVGAIYSAGLGEVEMYLIFTDIRNVQRLNGWSDNQISGYEVWTSDLNLAPNIAEMINGDVIYSSDDGLRGYTAYSAQSIYPSIFDWLIAHDINALVIIIIMMIVAIFNIITTLLILVLERTQMIGMLKVLGMQSSAIRGIFLIRAARITLRGLIFGNIAAITLCFVQQQFNLIKLNEEGYMLTSVPIDLSLWWIILLNVGVILTTLILVIIPTRIVSGVEPSVAIKY